MRFSTIMGHTYSHTQQALYYRIVVDSTRHPTDRHPHGPGTDARPEQMHSVSTECTRDCTRCEDADADRCDARERSVRCMYSAQVASPRCDLSLELSHRRQGIQHDALLTCRLWLRRRRPTRPRQCRLLQLALGKLLRHEPPGLLRSTN